MEGQSSSQAPPPWTKRIGGAGVEGQSSNLTPPFLSGTTGRSRGRGTKLQERDTRPSHPPSGERRNPGPDIRHSWEGQLEGNCRGKGKGDGTPPCLTGRKVRQRPREEGREGPREEFGCVHRRSLSRGLPTLVSPHLARYAWAASTVKAGS